MAVHRFYQHTDMLRRRELTDAVTEVEDLCGAGLARVGVGFTKGVQHAANLCSDGIGGRKQHVGVNVAL